MNVKYGTGATEYGPGVNIELSGDEVATAIDAYLVAHRIHIGGPRTVTVNGNPCEEGRVYVDPSGFVITQDRKYSGRGPSAPPAPKGYARGEFTAHKTMIDPSAEREEFDALVIAYEECPSVKIGGGGCACVGMCLGSRLAALRRKYDSNYSGIGSWWSDQLHGSLLIRPGDSGRPGAVLSADNYWTGAA